MQTPLRWANFLSPLLSPTYAAIIQAIGAATGHMATVEVGTNLADFAAGKIDVGFLCGLQYTRLVAQAPQAVAVLAAPVLMGRRYRGQPVYYSDIVVRADQPFQTWHDLQGCTWGFNEPTSHSGHAVVLATLRQYQRSWPFFGKRIETGSHLRSLDLVRAGAIDAAPIDSHIYDVWRSQRRHAARHVRSIGVFGPSPIPPIVVGKHVPAAMTARLRAALLHLHTDAPMAATLRHGRIARFVAVNDATYDPIRHMQTLCNQATI